MKISFLFLAIGLGIAGCTADKITPPVCYESEIAPMLQSNCALSGCHNSTTQAEGIDFSSYASITAFLDDEGNRELLKVLRDDGDDRMPPAPMNPLSDDQIMTIEYWLDGGAKNVVGCDTSSGCDTSAISFSQDVLPIFQTHCVGCHAGGGRDYSTHAGTVANSLTVLMQALRHEQGVLAMPDGSPKLDDCSIEKIGAWVNAGAPNN